MFGGRQGPDLVNRTIWTKSPGTKNAAEALMCSGALRHLRLRPALLTIYESAAWHPGIRMFPRVVLPWAEVSCCLKTSRSDSFICFNYRTRPCRERQTSHGLLHGCTKSSKIIDQSLGNELPFLSLGTGRPQQGSASFARKGEYLPYYDAVKK